MMKDFINLNIVHFLLELIKTIPMTGVTEGARVSAVIHPLTYQNKILVGFTNGIIKLININTCQIVHQFDRFEGRRINAIVQVK